MYCFFLPHFCFLFPLYPPSMHASDDLRPTAVTFEIKEWDRFPFPPPKEFLPLLHCNFIGAQNPLRKKYMNTIAQIRDLKKQASTPHLRNTEHP